jgi:hypothetical protein
MTTTTVKLVTGTPAAGKAALSELIAAAKTSGHEVLHLRDTGVHESAELIGQVLDEVRLRVHQPGTVAQPMLLAVADFDALMVPPVMPIDFPPGHPAIIRWRELQISQQQIRACIARIAREGAGTGVSIAVVTSDPDTSDLHRVFRDEITSTIHGPSQ